MLPDDRSTKTKVDNKFHRIEQRKSWPRFCSSIANLEDEEMRSRILSFVDATEDPMFYHKKCWDKYIYRIGKTNYHIQNITSTEITAMFVQHVQATVFDLNEPRTLQGLLIDYKNILSEFGQEVNAIKTSFIKSILENKFDDSI